MSETQQIIVATFDLFSLLVNACKRDCLHWKDGYNSAAFSLSLPSLSTLHINTNSAHLTRRHSNEIPCASPLYSLSLFFSLSLSLSLSLSSVFPSIVTLTAKQVLLISRACFVDVFAFYLCDRSHHIIQ